MSKKFDKAHLIDSGIIVLIVVLLSWAVLADSNSELSALVGKPAPAFKLATQSGKVIGTTDYAGKVMLLDFWATWCDPCFQQMPELQKVKRKHDGRLVVLAVNVDDPAPGRDTAIATFLKSAKIDVDSLIDDGSVSMLYNVESIPALVLIDSEGIVRYASTGVHTAKELNDRIAGVLGGS